MGRHLENDPIFFTIAGVARERRAEIGDAADLSADPVWVAALCFLGLESWTDEPAAENRMKRSRSIIDAMRTAGANGE
jgi:hypothetical protein